MGEAFDKVAKLLVLGYLGGAKLDKLAGSGNPSFVKFPRALRLEKSFEFSYSGLKTAVALYLKKLNETERENKKADIDASLQEAAVEVMVNNTVLASEQKNVSDAAL